MPTTPLALNSAAMPLVMVLTTPARRFCIVRQIELDVGQLDAVNRELILRALIQLGGLEQRLRGDAAGVQAGTAERVAPVGVLPFVDAGHFELVLRRRESPPG